MDNGQFADFGGWEDRTWARGSTGPSAPFHSAQDDGDRIGFPHLSAILSERSESKNPFLCAGLRLAGGMRIATALCASQ